VVEQGVVENSDDLLRLQNTYAAVVTYVDAQLGMIIDQVRHLNLREDMLVCLTASQGLPLGEHGAIGYVRPWLHEELVHLPLLMRLPRGERPGLRVDGLTQPVDLFTTFLEFLAITPPPSHSRSLWPLIRDEVNQIRLHAYSGIRSDFAVEWALRSRDWALVLPVASCPEDSSRQGQLYAKPEDRWEVNDVRQHHLELAEDMEKKLRDYAAESRQPGPPSR
jgi:arylsulfatase A-like enzyme